MGLFPATNAKMPTTTNKVWEETKRELHWHRCYKCIIVNTISFTKIDEQKRKEQRELLRDAATSINFARLSFTKVSCINPNHVNQTENKLQGIRTSCNSVCRSLLPAKNHRRWTASCRQQIPYLWKICLKYDLWKRKEPFRQWQLSSIHSTIQLSLDVKPYFILYSACSKLFRAWKHKKPYFQTHFTWSFDPISSEVHVLFLHIRANSPCQ